MYQPFPAIDVSRINLKDNPVYIRGLKSGKTTV